MGSIDPLSAELPHIEIIRSDDTKYGALRQTYSLAVEAQPSAIALPKTAEEVASLVQYARRTNAAICVRCGGHDMFGRSMIDGALVIDIRALDHVTVQKEVHQAVIGGGVRAEKLAEALAQHDCITPCPNIGTVGYIGYATTGGYGQMAHKFGLGVDQLLSAKIVDAEGNIVQASDDVMKGIRGAGGNFGVIVEATIKIYPFARVLSGPIIFESSDYQKTMHDVQAGMEALEASNDYPPELDLQPMYSFVPEMGMFYGALFMWAGPDIERGQQYLDKVLAFHSVQMNQVAPATMGQTHEQNKHIVPEHSHCDARALNVRRVTPRIYQILVDAYATMPHDPACMLTWHEVRSCSPSAHPSTCLPAVFGAREPHYVIEILCNAVDKAKADAVSKWGLALRDQIVREAPDEIMDTHWLASTPPHEIDSLRKFFGEDNARFLRDLKKKKDPQGVFRHALPSLE